MPLYRDVQPGDKLRIGDTVIEVQQKTGQRTRLRIDSALHVEHEKGGARLSMTPQPARAEPQAPPAQAPQPRLKLPPLPQPA